MPDTPRPETSTVTYLSSDPVGVEAPFDRPAKVRVAAGTNAVAGVGLQAGRIAQALAPDAAPWIQEAIAQGLGADWDSFATTPSDLTSVNRPDRMSEFIKLVRASVIAFCKTVARVTKPAGARDSARSLHTFKGW